MYFDFGLDRISCNAPRGSGVNVETGAPTIGRCTQNDDTVNFAKRELPDKLKTYWEDQLRRLEEGALKPPARPVVIVAGNADSLGTDAINMELAVKRATKIRDILKTSLQDTESDNFAPQIYVCSFGERRRLCDEHKDGRPDSISQAHNRRVDVLLVDDPSP